MKIAGFDIGGANTDLAIIDFEDGEIKKIIVDFEYLPMWSQNDRLESVLIDLIERNLPIEQIDAVGISMTAELVDAFNVRIAHHSAYEAFGLLTARLLFYHRLC